MAYFPPPMLNDAGLPVDLRLHTVGAEAVIAALADRCWLLDARPAAGAWNLTVTPKLVGGVVAHRGEFYDTRLARIIDGEIVALARGGWGPTFPARAHPATLFCGVRYADYQQALRTGRVAAPVLTADPAEAVAHATRGWHHTPTFDAPVIVLRVPDTCGSGGVVLAATTDVYVGRPYRVAAGSVELQRVTDEWTEGWRRSPQAWLVWKRVPPGGLALDAAHVYRLGFCVTCGTVTRQCINLGGAGSGNFGHGGRPGEVGGSSAGEGGTATADPPVTEKGSGETVTPDEVKSPALGTERPTPVKVKSVAEGVERILNGEVVELEDVSQVHTVLTKLAEHANEAKARGEEAKDFDLCNVSVAGSNLFCGSPLKTEKFPNGVPRIEMPQLKGKTVPGTPADAMPKDKKGKVDAAAAFVDHLQSQGIETDEVTEVAADSLKATQAQLGGADVARMMTSPTYDPAKQPIFISSDNYVLDGHHRWAAVVGRDAADGRLGDSKMKVIRVNRPMSELFHRAKSFTEEFGIEPKAHQQKRLRGFAARVFSLLNDNRFLLGGPGSGHHGHAGVPGQRGGSAAGEGGGVATEEPPAKTPTEMRDRSASSFTPHNPDGKDSQAQFKRPDGTYTEDRAKLHDEVLAQTMEGKTPIEKPTIIMLGGGPASGKTTLVNAQKIGEGNTVSINADEFKENLPEFKENPNDSTMAGRLHEETERYGAHAVAAGRRGRLQRRAGRDGRLLD